MSAYVVINYKITDAEGVAKYRDVVIPDLMERGCEFLVVNDDVEALEGSPAPTVIVLKFESAEAAKDWYNSPGYEAIRPTRLSATTDGWMALSEGFQMPG